MSLNHKNNIGSLMSLNHNISDSELNQTKQNTIYRKSQSHSFDVQNAELYGIECAILINHFQFWIEQNQAMGRNFHDGRTWMYQTQKEIAAIYPYWNRDKVQDILHKLEEFEVIIKGNYNKTNFDKTTWYAFKNEEIFTKVRNRTIDNANLHNQLRETAQPIPDTIPNTKQERIHTPPSHSVSQEAKECVCFFSSFHEKQANHITDLQKVAFMKEFTAMHEVDKIPWDEIKKIIEYAQSHEFWHSRTLTAKNLRKNAQTIKLQMKQAKKLSNEDHGLIDGTRYGDYICEIDKKEIHFRNLFNGTFEYLMLCDKNFKENLRSLINRLKI